MRRRHRHGEGSRAYVSDGFRVDARVPGYAGTAECFTATAAAALRMTSSTACGWESIGTWLERSSTVAAPIRFAADRSSSGWTVRSPAATMYQLGFDRQATPSSFCWNRYGHGLGRPDNVLLRLGQIPGEGADPAWTQPDPPVGDLDVGEDVSDGKLLLLVLRGFGLVGRKRRDVDEGRDSVVGPGMGDQRPAIGVADKDDGAADPPEAAGDAVDVAFQGVESMLGTHHLVPIRLQRRDELLEA
jgi:hypothetical protein